MYILDEYSIGDWEYARVEREQQAQHHREHHDSAFPSLDKYLNIIHYVDSMLSGLGSLVQIFSGLIVWNNLMTLLHIC